MRTDANWIQSDKGDRKKKRDGKFAKMKGRKKEEIEEREEKRQKL